MNIGNFYFISNDYYSKFKDCGLVENNENAGRPCFYSFKEKDSNICWMIPISSKISKYRKEYDKSINRYGVCDSIVFGFVLGEEKAFLIQNMCPVTENYITNLYIDKNTGKPVHVSKKVQSVLNAKIRKAVRLYRRGIKIVLSNALYIEEELIKELDETKAKSFEMESPL